MALRVGLGLKAIILPFRAFSPPMVSTNTPRRRIRPAPASPSSSATAPPCRISAVNWPNSARSASPRCPSTKTCATRSGLPALHRPRGQTPPVAVHRQADAQRRPEPIRAALDAFTGRVGGRDRQDAPPRKPARQAADDEKTLHGIARSPSGRRSATAARAAPQPIKERSRTNRRGPIANSSGCCVAPRRRRRDRGIRRRSRRRG